MSETEIHSLKQFGGVNDLAGVISEMLGDVRDGTEPGHAKALDLELLSQLARRGCRQNPPGLRHGRFNLLNQGAAGDGAEFLEFSVAVPEVRLIPEAGNDPLPDVTRQMHHQVTNAVRTPMGTPPDLVLGKSLEASDDPREMLPLE